MLVPSRRRLRLEVWIVLGLSLGQSAVYSVVQLLDKMTREGPAWRGIGFGLVMGILALTVVIGGGLVMREVSMMEGADKAMVAQVLDYFKAAGFIVLGYVFGASVKQKS